MNEILKKLKSKNVRVGFQFGGAIGGVLRWSSTKEMWSVTPARGKRAYFVSADVAWCVRYCAVDVEILAEETI